MSEDHWKGIGGSKISEESRDAFQNGESQRTPNIKPKSIKCLEENLMG